MMDYKPLFTKLQQEYPHEKCFHKIISRFQEVFDDDDFSDNSRIKELFYMSDKIGKTQFFRLKKYVLSFYQWLIVNGYATKTQYEYIAKLKFDDIMIDNLITKSYFKDLDSVIDFINLIGSQFGVGQSSDLLPIKAVAVLAWYGLSREAISNCQQNDLIVEEYSVFVKSSNTKVYFERHHFEILINLALQTQYSTIPSAKIYQFKPSTYLLRTYKASYLTPQVVSQIVKRFNNISHSLIGRGLSIVDLNHNGMLYKIFMQRDVYCKSPNKTIQQITGCNRHTVFWYRSMYEQWLNLYYPDGGDIK